MPRQITAAEVVATVKPTDKRVNVVLVEQRLGWSVLVGIAEDELVDGVGEPVWYGLVHEALTGLALQFGREVDFQLRFQTP